MKTKSLIALAAFAASGGAMAQSSVTLFGVVDTGVAYINSTGAGHAVGLVTGGNTTSRLGFRGTEDLGGGLAASFWLEGGLNSDVGGGASQTTGLDFARRSTISLSGNFGELRMGRDFAAHYVTLFSYDVTYNRGLGAMETPGVAGAGTTLNAFRVSNAVSYFLPATLGGFYGQAQYSFGERASNATAVTNAAGLSTSAANAATEKTGNYAALRGGYANGPLDISASYGNYSDAVRTVGVVNFASSFKAANIGAAWDFGVVKPMVFFQQEKIGGRATVAEYKLDTYNIGATAPIGAGLLRVQASHYDLKNSSNDANKVSAGYVYNLSKRTAIYGEAARIKNKGAGTYTFGGIGGLPTAGTPTPGGSSTGYVVGVKHSF